MIPDHISPIKRRLLHGKLRDIGLGKVAVGYRMRLPKRKGEMKKLFYLVFAASMMDGCATGEVDVKELCEEHAEYIFNKENAFVEAGYPADKVDLLRTYANFANYCRTDSLTLSS